MPQTFTQFIPEGILTLIGGGVVTVVGGIVASKLKAIPFKITWGSAPKNGKTYITREELSINCERVHSGTEKSLTLLLENQKGIADKVEYIRDRVSFIEGKLDVKR
jgi:hypothetical protein